MTDKEAKAPSLADVPLYEDAKRLIDLSLRIEYAGMDEEENRLCALRDALLAKFRAADAKRERMEEALRKLEDEANDLAHIREEYIDAMSSGKFRGRNITKELAKGFAHDFGERASALQMFFDSFARTAITGDKTP